MKNIIFPIWLALMVLAWLLAVAAFVAMFPARVLCTLSKAINKFAGG